MFSASYRTLLLNNLMSLRSPGSNCEEDFGNGCLTSYNSLFETYENEEVPENDEASEVEKRISDSMPKSTRFDSKLLENLGCQTKNYIAGYIVKKLNTVLFKNCSCCLQ